MDKPLPTPPKRYDLVERFNALALAGRKPVDKKLPDTRRYFSQDLAGGPQLLAPNVAFDKHHRPPPAAASPSLHQDARTALQPREKALPVPPSRHIREPKPVPQPPKSSLTMQYALKLLRPNTPTKPVMVPPPRRPSPNIIVPTKEELEPPASCPSESTLNKARNRPRACSAPLSPTLSSPGRNTVQCSAITLAGKQCSRQIKPPATHSHLDPTPALYCHQHKEVIKAKSGFYPRNGKADEFVEFPEYIPKYLQLDTQLALRVEMEKAIAAADCPGYIYTFEIRDPKRPSVIQLKVGRAKNLNKRLDQWDKQCASKQQILRGWWPSTVDDDEGIGCSLLKGSINAGEPGPLCHRVERLVHLELLDLSLYAPYLDPKFPENVCDSAASTPKKATKEKAKCFDCGKDHQEIFTFPRPEEGKYKGKEWDLIVKPVIEKWGRFVKEYYT